MASLVADYGSDEDSNENSDTETEQNIVQSVVGCLDSGSATESRNFLITQDGGSDSDEEKKKQESVSKASEKLPKPMLEKLPSPAIGKKKSQKKKKKVVLEGSVFVNPFEKAEQAKQSILEKHVKMTENQHVTGKNVKICWKFRKGRCPFGSNCKYSHDVDSNLSLKYQTNEADISANEQSVGKNQNRRLPNLPPPPKPVGFMGTIGTMNSAPRQRQTTSRSYSTYRQQLQDKEDEADDDNYMMSAKKKKRSGVAQNLVPPKKAMMALSKQRTEERPWTVQKN